MFRVSIRDMLWLILAIALALCWLVDHQRASRLQAQYEQLVTETFRSGTHVEREALQRDFEQRFNALSHRR